jgi:hypothetical protein
MEQMESRSHADPRVRGVLEFLELSIAGPVEGAGSE